MGAIKDFATGRAVGMGGLGALAGGAYKNITSDPQDDTVADTVSGALAGGTMGFAGGGLSGYDWTPDEEGEWGLPFGGDDIDKESSLQGYIYEKESR